MAIFNSYVKLPEGIRELNIFPPCFMLRVSSQAIRWCRKVGKKTLEVLPESSEACGGSGPG